MNFGANTSLGSRMVPVLGWRLSVDYVSADLNPEAVHIEDTSMTLAKGRIKILIGPNEVFRPWFRDPWIRAWESKVIVHCRYQTQTPENLLRYRYLPGLSLGDLSVYI